MSNQSIANNPSAANLSQVPPMRSFEFDANVVGKLKSSVNQFRGSVALPVDFFTLPGRDGLDVKVAGVYSSAVKQDVAGWNVESPTGILGLGWQMPFEMITVSKGGSAGLNGDTYFLVSAGSASELVKTAEDAEGRSIFQLHNYQFWDIRYDPRLQSWTIVHENGFVYTYGGLAGQANAVQWGISWGNWIGSSAMLAGQQRFPAAWNLASVASPAGGRVDYTYVTVDAQVGAGPLSYTRACYLAQVTDSYRRTVNFNYAEKYGADNPSPDGGRIVEYRARHPNQRPDSAYQDKYETRYLASIDVAGADGATLSSLHFSYRFLNAGASGAPTYALLWKRVLAAVWQSTPDGSALPSLKFDYYDGQGDLNRGALKSVTDPAGGVTRYTYKANPINAPKALTLPNPLPGSAPGVWHGDDYMAFSYCLPGGAVRLLACSWNGQWVTADITAQAMRSANADPESVRVICAPGYLALSLRNSAAGRDELYIFRKDPTRFGGWTLYTGGPQQMNLKAGPAVASSVVAGVDFIFAYNPGYVAGPFQAFSYNWKSGIWDTPTAMPSAAMAAAADAVVVAAREHFYLVAFYTAASRQAQFALFYRDLGGAWHAAPQWRTDKLAIVSSGGKLQLALELQSGGAVATYVTAASDKAIDYSVSIYQWNESFVVLNGALPETVALTNPVSGSSAQYGSIQTLTSDASVSNNLANLRNVGGVAGPGNANWLLRRFEAPAVGATTAFAAGADVAVMCVNQGGRQRNTLLTFDPNVPNQGGWQVSGAIDQNGRAATVSGDYMTVGSTIYSRILTGSWSALAAPLSGLVAQETVQNRGGNYIAYQDRADSQARSFVVMLANGAAEAAVPLPGPAQKIYVPAAEARAGTTLAGPRFLVAYPAAATFAQAATLTLYCLDSGPQSQYEIDYPVAYVEIDNPCAPGLDYVQSFFYSNSAQSQVAYNAATGVAQYPRVVVVEGVKSNAPVPPAEQPLGRSQYFYSNGLSAQAALPYQHGWVYNYQSVLNGMLLASQDYDAAGLLVASELNYWSVGQIDANTGTRLHGAYVRLQRTTSMRDGVVQDSETVYDTRTGVQLIQQQSYTDANGLAKVLRCETTYAWQVPAYQGVFRQRHLLTAEVKSTKSVGVPGGGVWNTIQSEATTWRDWAAANGPSLLAPLAVYQWCGPGAPTFDFGAGGDTQPGWTLRMRVSRRSGSGLIVEQANTNGIPSSYLYDRDGNHLVAKFPNGSLSGDEVAYCGFEDYEAAHGWRLGTGARVVPDADHPQIDAHTGTRSVRLAPGASMQRSFAPRRQDQAYVFSAWVKKPEGFDAAGGDARWTIAVGGAPVVTLAFPAQSGQWLYLMQAIALPGGTPVAIVITCENANAACAVLVDDLRFSPLNCLFDATGYAPAAWLPNATMGANGETSRTVYDAFDRPVLATNPADRMARFGAAAFSRSVNGGVFDPAAPNASLALRFVQGGALATFTRGAEWRGLWTDPSDAWRQAGATLTQRAGANARLALSDPLYCRDYAIAVNFRAIEAVSAPFGLQLPQALSVQWNPQALAWELLDGASNLLERAAGTPLLTLPPDAAAALDAGTLAQSVSAAFGAAGYPLAPGSTVVAGPAGRWTLAAPDQRYFYYLATTGAGIAVHRPGSNWIALAGERSLLFWVDGAQLFSHQSALPFTAPPVLFFGSRVAIASLAAGRAVQAAATFTDTRGVAIQAHALADDGRAVVSQTIPDAGGRPAVSTKSAYVAAADSPLLSYCGGFATLDWRDGQLGGLVAASYPDDAGYAYARVRYEASPLGRALEQGMPGAAFRIGAHATHIAYTAVPSGAGPGLLHRTSTTDPNGNLVYEISNELGQVFGKVSRMQDAATLRNTTLFDDAGNPIELRSPNYYAPPAGSTAADWVTVQSFDSAGRCVSSQTGSAPASTSIYDAAGNLRFTQDGAGAAAGNVNYILYDRLNRPREKGVVAAAWDRTRLQHIADTDPAWPAAASDWRKRYAFDGTQADLHGLGRICEVLVNNGGDVVTESYAYDVFGNTRTRTVAAAPFAAHTVDYRFDDAGNTSAIVYPEAPDGTRLQVDYRINRLNQIVAIARAGHAGTPLASFSYQANGRPLGQELSVSERGAVRLGFAFNSPLWISAISATNAAGETLFDESLSYTGGGYEDAGYHDGTIAATKCQYAAGALPANRYAYAFNALGQITHAHSTPDAGFDLGAPTPVSYDPNGNFASAALGQTVRNYEYQAGSQRVARVLGGDHAVLASYTYDASGNALTSETAASPFARAHRLSFTYDEGTAMTTRITDADADLRLGFAYDSYDRRLLKTVTHGGRADTCQLYVRGMNAQPLFELRREGASTATAHYVYGPGGLLAMFRDGAGYAVIKDHLGSVRAVLDETARVVASYDYLSFGALAGALEPAPGFMPYLYTGQEYDHEVELYDYRARFYAPELGRFLGVDPRRQYFSPYLYAANNPVLYIDPTGEFSIGSLFSAIGGMLIGAVEILIGAVIDVIAGVLEVVTGGLGTPASIALASLAGAFYGAGTGAIAYSVFNFDNFDWRDYGIQMGIGALAGAITFGFGAAGEAAGEGLTQVATLGNAASNSAKFANYAIQTAATTAGGVAANSVSQALNNVASGVAPGADIGSAILWGAIGDVAGSTYAVSSYKAGFGNLGKRVLQGVAKAEVLGIAITLTRNAANGDALDDGLIETMFAGAMSGTLDGLKLKDAATQSTKPRPVSI
jgi:RHS repeat-associated protein